MRAVAKHRIRQGRATAERDWPPCCYGDDRGRGLSAAEPVGMCTSGGPGGCCFPGAIKSHRETFQKKID